MTRAARHSPAKLPAFFLFRLRPDCLPEDIIDVSLEVDVQVVLWKKNPFLTVGWRTPEFTPTGVAVDLSY